MSFNQWQVWAVLCMAGICGYLSLSVHYAHKDLAAVNALVGAMSSLDLDRPNSDRANEHWMVSAQHLMPSLALHAAELTAKVQAPLDRLTQQVASGTDVSLIEQAKVRQQLAWLESEIKAKGAAMELQTAQVTHFYYLAVILFLFAIAAFLSLRWSLARYSSLNHYLSDDSLFANVPVALTISDVEDKLIRVNSAFEELTGFASKELLGSRAMLEETDEDQLHAEKMRAELDKEGIWSGMYPIRCKDGHPHSEKVMRVQLTDGDQAQGYLTLSLEATRSDAQQRLMLWQAHHDNLTKLPNANLLEDRLTQALQDDRRGAVICIDLDNFKDTNDSIGHAGADRVLIEAAHRIAMTSREGDTVARIGGDVFAIVIPEFNDIADVEHAARNAVEAIRPAFLSEEGELFMSASAGVAIFPDDGSTTGELLQKANSARGKAKQEGGDQLSFFETQMNALAERRFELEVNLRKAMARNEFELHFQPLVDISKQEVYGAEALLRWRSEQLGMVSPAEFIPVAEATGLIVEIGRWVVEEVQCHLEAWQTQLPNIRISLNVSARQLDKPEEVQRLLDLLASGYGDQITIELTESLLVEDDSAANVFLRGLSDLGIHVALDDFGTGYSSIGYLRDYEFDLLKVDKSFIDGVTESRDLGLVASIVAMGRILGMRIVAEGVEDAAQVEELRNVGCDFVQGYYFSKPLPAQEFACFVHNWDPTAFASLANGASAKLAGQREQ